MTTQRFARSILLGSLLCGMSLSTVRPSVAASCGSEIQDSGVVKAIIDARTLRLNDGRDVRLAGVEVVAGASDDRRPTLAALIGRQVILRGDGDDPDRYGRQSAFIYLEPSASSIQSELLERGEALALGDVADKTCAAELATAEAAARQARRGTWANSSVIKNVENPVDILTRIGQFTVVEGKVLSVRQAGGTVYINFGQRWTRDFAATISRRMIPYFEAAGVAPVSLENRRVRIRGWVERRGGPRINVLRVGQIEVIGD
jgi:hypothetical protein